MFGEDLFVNELLPFTEFGRSSDLEILVIEKVVAELFSHIIILAFSGIVSQILFDRLRCHISFLLSV